jgi:hypothetical protein
MTQLRIELLRFGTGLLNEAQRPHVRVTRVALASPCAYERARALQRQYVQDQPIYPYLLVNIGSGVSIVKVCSNPPSNAPEEAPEKALEERAAEEAYAVSLSSLTPDMRRGQVEAEGVYERISGTNIGGGTFWGLCRLLTGVKR